MHVLLALVLVADDRCIETGVFIRLLHSNGNAFYDMNILKFQFLNWLKPDNFIR